MISRTALLVVVGAVAVALSACGSPKGAVSGGKGSAAATLTAPSVVATAGPSGGATFAKYSKIKIGMTYQQVVQIMGNPGARPVNPNPTMDDKGATQVSPRGATVYVWMSTEQGNRNLMHVTFVKNKVTAKDQAGLP